jgi:hypothetical protein
MILATVPKKKRSYDADFKKKRSYDADFKLKVILKLTPPSISRRRVPAGEKNSSRGV